MMKSNLRDHSQGKLYSIREEIANGITHGIGVLFGIAVLVILLVLSIGKGDTLSIVAFSIYGISIVLMYLSSTLYHSITNLRMKRIIRVFDHSSIYLFIAGTYTPIALLTLGGALRIIVLLAVWSIAIFGVLFKISTYKRMDKYKRFSLALYLGMGWIAVFTIKPMIHRTSLEFFLWILVGGLFYTLGTIFYSVKRIPYHHAIWHLFVLCASIVQFLGIFLYLT